MDYSFILNRSKSLFEEDIKKFENSLSDLIKSSKILVIGGAGSIGMSVTNEIFKREPRKLHIVDFSILTNSTKLFSLKSTICNF